MAFPSSPSDKEIYKQYRFNINIGAWRKYEYYGMYEESAGSSALDILNKNPNANVDGVYWIKPDSNPAFQVYCDMTTDGGGWIILDNDIAPVSTTYRGSTSWSEDILTVNIQEVPCAEDGRQYLLGNPKNIGYSEVTMLMQRVSTVGQCSSISGKVDSGYFNASSLSDYNGSFVSSSMCNWSPPWATSSGNDAQDMSGLEEFWVIKAEGPQVDLLYSAKCASGTGTHYHKWMVR